MLFAARQRPTRVGWRRRWPSTRGAPAAAVTTRPVSSATCSSIRSASSVGGTSHVPGACSRPFDSNQSDARYTGTPRVTYPAGTASPGPARRSRPRCDRRALAARNVPDVLRVGEHLPSARRSGSLRNIPVHLRTALRRALEFEARAPAPRSAEEAEQCEEQLRAIADEFFGALLTPVLQRAVCSAAVGDAASALVRHLPRRMRSDGLETVNVRTSRGTTVPVTTPYYREKHARRAKRRPGLYPALVVLGIYDRCTPKLASDASRAVAMLSSLAEAQAQLRSDGIALDIKTLRSTAYRYAARARAAQQSAACGLLDRVTGKRVVVSLDGGRVRVRRKKRGPKTKKGRNRFHTDWKEPKLLILYVVGDDGRPSQTWAPIIDGTLRGPEAVFALLLSYARQIGLNAADKVLFIADGAPWIWRRLQRLIAALGLSPTQVLGLIDFYHAAKQLSDAVKLRRWSATQRTRWLNRTRGLLKRARVDEVITALRELCRGRTAGKIRTHLNYFLKNRHRFAYTTMVGLGLPRGSGAVESAIRRVINLRIKGASIYWLPESVDAILLLRSFYKSGRWNCLQRMAMTPVGVSA